MREERDNKGIRVMCLVMFVAFGIGWTYFFQSDIIGAAFSAVTGKSGLTVPYYPLTMSLLLTGIALLLVFPMRWLMGFKNGLYATHYVLAAVFLGLVAGYDGQSMLGQTMTEWILSGVLILLLIIVCKMVSALPKYDNAERSVAGALLIMTLLFCMTALLGNTNENMHRRLMMERYSESGNYEKVLQIGKLEEESDESIDMIRAKAMLECGNLGDRLFEYSISNPKALAEFLESSDSVSIDAFLLKGDIKSVVDSIDLFAYKELPKYYAQAMVLAGDLRIQDMFPEEYSKASDLYNQFLEALEPVKNESEQYQANTTYIKFHDSYYWFYSFKL